MNHKVTELLILCMKINAHPLLSTCLHRDNKESVPALYIPNDASPKFLRRIGDLAKLIEELALFADTELISKDGQSSNLFYEIRKHGFTSRITESDSFGPLGSMIRPPNSHWSFHYG